MKNWSMESWLICAGDGAGAVIGAVGAGVGLSPSLDFFGGILLELCSVERNMVLILVLSYFDILEKALKRWGEVQTTIVDFNYASQEIYRKAIQD